jgi:hypothetical protein
MESGYRIISITLTQAVVAVIEGLIVHKTGRYLELNRLGVTLQALGNGIDINLNVATARDVVVFQIVAATSASLLF